jgi:hypothetical protein
LILLAKLHCLGIAVLCRVTTLIGEEEWDSQMAAPLGKIEPFDPEAEEWPDYVERLLRS